MNNETFPFPPFLISVIVYYYYYYYYYREHHLKFCLPLCKVLNDRIQAYFQKYSIRFIVSEVSCLGATTDALRNMIKVLNFSGTEKHLELK